MQLTLFTDYSLRAMMFLMVHQTRLCNIREIANHYDISYNHLVKIVHKLVQLGYIESIKGKGGGIQLAEGIAKHSLGNLVEALEPNMDVVECFNNDTNTCRITESCQLKHYLFNAKKAFIAVLNNHTLEDTTKNSILFPT